MKLIFTKKGRGIVIADPRFLFLALLRSDVDQKPVLALFRIPTRRGTIFLFRPLSKEV